ncbi:reactive intermediate/imine deaminase [Pseudomonas putida]|nr:reactive intermediate/imine deaminase [Pseudomonas putida]
MAKSYINSDKAPAAVGTYSQAVRAGDILYMSGQIPLDPSTMKLVDGIENQIVQVFQNLSAVIHEAGKSFGDVVKLNIYLTDMECFPLVNAVMARYFTAPFPARAAIGVASLPLGAKVEMEALVYMG